MSQSRQLAAIMFTDIVGYTALMGSDDKKAFSILKKNREIQKPVIEECNGRWIKEMGDGTIASFNTASDALAAAKKIQEACAAVSDLQLRIGIHLGEVVFENNDVFGDGVNIASRIESLGIAGSVLLSKTVRDQVKNQTEYQLQSLGHFDFKNVSEPIEVFGLSNPGLAVPKREQMQGKLKQPQRKSVIPKWIIIATVIAAVSFVVWFIVGKQRTLNETGDQSIAVLPFVNMSNDPQQEYFSDGISEEIINVLAQVPDMKVIGRTSSFAFKGKNQDLREIGDLLAVRYVLEGSVRKAGNKLRITAQLIEAATGFHIYSETFDREMEDVFTIQDEISMEILNAIKVKLLGDQKEGAFTKGTTNLEAYQLFLQGRYWFNKLNPEAFAKAIEYYEAAIKADPDYALAYAEMSGCYWDMAYYNWGPRDFCISKAIAAIDKALELDSKLAESHINQGRLKLWYEWDFEGAAEALEKGIRINPNNVEGIRQLGALNMITGNYKSAHRYIQKADQLDPFSFLSLTYLGSYYTWEGNWEKVLEYGNRLIDMEPEFFGGHILAAYAYLGFQRYADAITETEYAVKLNGDLQNLSSLGVAYASNGNKKKAQDVLEEMKKRTIGKNEGNIYIGSVYAAMGEWDQAFQYYNRGVLNHEGHALTLGAAFRGNPVMKNDPRTRNLLERIGLLKYEDLLDGKK